MTVAVQEYAKALDIWGIIKPHIDFKYDLAIHCVDLHLEVQENPESYVDVTYYELETITDQRSIWEEEPVTKRFKLTLEDTNEMYSDLMHLVHLPERVLSVDAHLDHFNVTNFEVKMIPLLRK
jgi:hypothetical protein